MPNDRFARTRWTGREPIYGRGATPAKLAHTQENNAALYGRRAGMVAKLKSDDQIRSKGLVHQIARLEGDKVFLKVGMDEKQFAPEFLDVWRKNQWISVATLK